MTLSEKGRDRLHAVLHRRVEQGELPGAVAPVAFGDAAREALGA